VSKPLKTVIEPVSGFQIPNVKEIWFYRELFWVLLSRDIRVRYKQTILGGLWALIQPFMMMVVFSVIFGKFAKVPSDGFPYPIFLYSALLPWTLFASTLSESSGAILGSGYVVKKIYFPRLIIPIAAAGNPVVDYLVANVLMIAMAIYFSIAPGWQVVLIPLMVFFLSLAGQGVGMILGSLSVSYRDFRHIIPFVVQIWMFMTPVIYGSSLLPEAWQFLLVLNPITGLVEGCRHIWLGQAIDLWGVGLSSLFCLAIFVIGLSIFQQQENKMADRI
jgi:lipopolysaccharide transport system permease protein